MTSSHGSSTSNTASPSLSFLGSSDSDDSKPVETPEKTPADGEFPDFDKEIKPREMRLDAQNLSQHYYAVRNRLDTKHLADKPSLPDFHAFKAEKLLPTKQDFEEIQSNFIVHISRVLSKSFPFFKKFASGMKKHIVHQYYQQTSQESEVVRSTFY